MGSVAASPGFDVYIVLRVLVNSCDDRACLALVDESVARLVGRESAYKTHFALAHANHASPCLAAVNRYPCICKYYVYMLRPWLRLFCWETAQYLGTSVPFKLTMGSYCYQINIRIKGREVLLVSGSLWLVKSWSIDKKGSTSCHPLYPHRCYHAARIPEFESNPANNLPCVRMFVWFTPFVLKWKGHGLVVTSNEEGVLAKSPAFIASSE